MSKRIKTTLGGDRLGSGNRNKIEMHNYYRSNHNLSCSRISSMAPGVLYPMYVNIGLTGDTWDIDLNSFIRTLPTEGPLFGAFKLQVDVFSADMRLYQAILHNNTTEIGFDMDQVLMPKMMIGANSVWNKQQKKWENQIAKNALLYYLGLAGVGVAHDRPDETVSIYRKLNAIPMLAYYDIFKNYYANKQEENAYVINNQEINPTYEIEQVNVNSVYKCDYTYFDNASCQQVGITKTTLTPASNGVLVTITQETTLNTGNSLILFGSNFLVYNIQGEKVTRLPLEIGTLRRIAVSDTQAIYESFEDNNDITNINFTLPVVENYPPQEQRYIQLTPFPLKNIDEMRKRLLTYWDLGEEFIMRDDENGDIMPYQSVLSSEANKSPMQGLVVKCYQSDWFNNWLDSEYIEKIAQKSNVNVTNGSFSIDALNFAKKLYDHYNRIAVTGGTYDDWQKAAYGMVRYGKAEKPIYHGGMSSEVIFDEVVSSAQTINTNGEINPLGSLGGRGTLKTRKGGHVIVKCNEQCVIMIMVSLTPRITQTQGNAWYLTELDSMNDLHQPDFDRIGFQDLITEQLAWWDTNMNEDGEILSRTSVGKQPAWLQYQTDIDKAYGDMAEENGYGYMILQRQYETDEDTKGVKDITTYIDPSKYNYAFAVSSLTAQNFWGFFNFDIKVRRLMSAKQMPNV